MGALLSLPLAGASMATSAVASCVGAGIGSMACAGLSKCSSSIATRVGYAVLFLVNSLLSWVMLTDWAIRKLEKITFDYVKISCLGSECHGFAAVQRVNFALGLFHLVMACLLIGVKSSKHPRASIQNGYWVLKVFAWIGLIILTFLIPEGFFVVWGNYFAIALSLAFILIGLVLLVDFAHASTETALRHIEEEDSRFWRFLLVGGTLGMYIASLVLTIIMYVYFAGSGCSMNQTAISLNLIFTLAVAVLSVNEKVQEHNPQAGLAQSAMVSVYCAYLIMSAVASEPDDKSCNPLIRSKGTRTASIVLGALFTFLAIAYTTTRAATTSSRYEAVPSSGISVGGGSLVTEEPTRMQMRQEALRQAVDEGVLPASALTDPWDSEDDDDGDDDERSTTQYNYVIFHIIFLLATQWTATLLTMNVEEEMGDFAPVGRTYFSSWVKIVSSWICYLLYAWTLVAPVLYPDRF